jgi:GMP synthase (glutamine-hydrolysing)
MDKIVVLDFGGQYAHLIANRVRRLGVYSDIVDGETPASELRDYKGIILSGGPQSVHEEGSLKCDAGIFQLGVPVLGICYGHQLMADILGGLVEPGERSEYGKTFVDVLMRDGIFEGLESEEVVWMSHFDQVTKVPEDFEIIAKSADCPIAGMMDKRNRFYGVQFHPEVTHTLNGMRILENFVEVTEAKREWSIEKFIENEIGAIREKVGERKVFMLVSGGVDSTVAFTLLEKALGNDRIFGLFVDTGFLRKGERESVDAALKGLGITNFRIEDASGLYFESLNGVYDPEKKRAIIGAKFIEVQKKVLNEMGLSADEWMLGQGTIYPDTIETGGTKHADKIKTHHNRVSEVQDMIEQGLVIEPISQLYKDEVREVGEKLGLPHELVWRHPFPGPGLAVRCLCNEVESGEDFGSIETKIAKFAGVYSAKVLPIKSVGVQGDVRSYRHPVLLSGGEKDWDELSSAATQVVNNSSALNRALYLLSPERVDSVSLVKAYLTPERIAVLQEADKIVMDFVLEKGLDREIWQFPTVMVPMRVNVGAGGVSSGSGASGASVGESIVLRPVESEEAMTANFYRMKWELLEELVGRLKAVRGVCAVFYDITNKPPATIEWE